MRAVKSCYFRFLLLATCAVLAQCAREPLMPTDQFDDNPDEKPDDGFSLHKRPSFFIGSRYGRSGGGIVPRSASAKTRRLIVVPRNERFFLGSRYGKRNGEYMSPYEQNAFESAYHSQNGFGATTAASVGLGVNLAAGPDATSDNQLTANSNNKLNGNNDSSGIMPQIMSCFYSGIKDYYRCNSIPGINNIINQLSPQHFLPNDPDEK